MEGSAAIQICRAGRRHGGTAAGTGCVTKRIWQHPALDAERDGLRRATAGADNAKERGHPGSAATLRAGAVFAFASPGAARMIRARESSQDNYHGDRAG